VFAGSPIKRIGRERFLRNVLIALGNSGAPDARGSVEQHLDEHSALVRAMAVWALERLLEPSSFAALRERHLPRERDPAVRAEWLASGGRQAAE
jgi:epoxyqueuosine reductase